ncbi:abortive infection family protein [Lentzea alba]|uniref:abortive infection family protein n=2 Tax=Lentzea alba TaxID=2714351 RepID=UPI0039BF8D50
MDWSADDLEGDDEPPSIDELETGLDQVDTMLGMLAAAATDQPSNPRQYLRLRRQLNDLLVRANIKSPFRWSTLDEWAAASKVKFPRNYAGRRTYVAQITDRVRDALQELLDEAQNGALTQELDDLGAVADDALDDPSGIRVELGVLPDLLRSDLRAAVGKAKNLVEATAKAVLAAHGQQAPQHSFDKSVNAALRTLNLDPNPTGNSPEAQAMRLLKELSSFVGTLRNDFGDGHGSVRAHTSVESRHARLTVRAAMAWCYFALETLQDQNIDD